jgi:hypothetical protein
MRVKTKETTMSTLSLKAMLARCESSRKVIVPILSDELSITVSGSEHAVPVARGGALYGVRVTREEWVTPTRFHRVCNGIITIEIPREWGRRVRMDQLTSAQLRYVKNAVLRYAADNNIAIEDGAGRKNATQWGYINGICLYGPTK